MRGTRCSSFWPKIVDEHHKYCHSFSSSCVPEGWSVLENVTDCSQICTGVNWLRNPSIWMENAPIIILTRATCIPIATEPYDPSRVWEQYQSIIPADRKFHRFLHQHRHLFHQPPHHFLRRQLLHPSSLFLPSAQPTYSPEITPTTEVTKQQPLLRKIILM